MTASGTKNVRVGYSWIGILLFICALSLLTAVPAHAGNCVSDYGGVIDGFVNPVPPAQVQIDGNCTFKNFPVSNPLTTNISFYTQPGQNIQRWLVIFDNVDFIGQMSCDAVQGHHIWFVNGSFTNLQPNCQNLFIPVEKIDKQNPAGQTTAAIGVPFTYKLTIPVLYDSQTGTVINNSGSPNDLHSVTVTDDLNATGAVLSYVSHTAYWKDSGTPVSHSFSNVGGVLTFSNFPVIPAGQQIVIEITVVLNDDPANAPGTQFFNTAKWEFGRLIDGIYYEPLPGEWGITPPMTIVAPNLVVTKTGPATMSLGQPAQFALNVQNSGSGDAWNVTILDRLPRGATGGTCDTTPQVLNAQVFEADGVTPVAGKGPLVAGTDFSINYSGAPTCELTLTVLTAAATIGPDQRLIITYGTELDANTQIGAQLTNVAGAVQWFNADSSVSTRQAFTRTLTDGTPGILDFQDAHTVTVVISALTITKQVSVVGGGAAMPGGQLEYLVHVTNVSTDPASSVVITDDLSTAGSGLLTFVDQSATMNGSTTGLSIVGSGLTADYSAVNGPLQPGQSIDVRFRALIATGLPAGTTITNTAVVTWNIPPQSATASVSIDIGGVLGAGTLNGTVWHDANFNKTPDPSEPLLEGWTVGLYRNGVLVQSALTSVSGTYSFSGVPPTDGTTERYELRFTAPGAGPNTAKLGKADSAYTNELQRITDIVVPSGSNLQNLNLPIAPNGVVYNSTTRAPIAGATLNMLRAGSREPLPATCFDDPAQQGQITLAGGHYRFDLNFSDPACPSGGSYLITVTAPTSTYVAGESQVIPPTSDASTTPFSVPTCPGSAEDALPAIPYCEAQVSDAAPPPSVSAGSAGTRYYLNLTLDGSQVPGSSQIYNNHIPLDPELSGSIAISKTTPLLNVTRGQLVPYVITVNNLAGGLLTDVSIVDRMPAGFTYVKGSALLDGVPTEPSVAGLELSWNGLDIAPTQARTVRLLLAVGGGVTEGEYVNRAQAVQAVTGTAMSGEATATVRIVPDPTFDCTDVTGKVFNDANRNGRQDDGENGLPGVRVVTPRGLEATTDQYGRYHITCAITPNESRGSNFVLKLDDRTLPSGFRMSTNQVQIKRATRGKALRLDFGASIYRVVGIDLSDAVFEPGKTEIRPQWRPDLNLLLEELRKAPAVLRLSYIADTEDVGLVERRVKAVEGQLTKAWGAANESYVLTIEPEVFWRRGAPPKRSYVQLPGSK
jgi:uncharacterized repeat protein (TIGR01451 family)